MELMQVNRQWASRPDDERFTNLKQLYKRAAAVKEGVSTVEPVLNQLRVVPHEDLSNGDSAKWHVQLAEKIAALPDNVNWQPILHKVHVGLLRVAYRTAGSAQAHVQIVIDLHERAAKGEDVSAELWSAARSAVVSAVVSAARSTARSAAYLEMRDSILIALSYETENKN